MERKDGKRSFYVFECVKCKGICKCGKNAVKLIPTGSRMSSKQQLSAARKAGGEICRKTKKDECTVFLREAGIHDRVRRYIINLKDFLAFEPTKDTIRKQRGKNETFERDSEELIWWNARYQKLVDKDGKPKALGLKPEKNADGKYEYKKLWEKSDLETRNQAYIAVSELEKNLMPKIDAVKHYDNIIAADVINGKYVLCTFPGGHNVIRARTPVAKYTEILPIPENTVMHVEEPEETKVPAKRGRKKIEKPVTEEPKAEVPVAKEPEEEEEIEEEEDSETEE